MSMGMNAFLFTDDYSGVVYYVFQKGKPESAHNTGRTIGNRSLRSVPLAG